MNDLIGQQIDNYRIETLLGEGGMGAVYRAQDIHLNRPVALKMISRRLGRDPDFQRRFLQEARAAARLKHPSIVQIYHFGARQGSLYMAMAYIPGQTLGTYIRRLQKTERVIMLSESLILTAQVAEALGYAHRQGVVHRDIKPDNIMLEPLDAPEREGEPAIRAVVTDFGLAKLLEGGLETQTNTFLGTLPYMSPEQCRGRNIDGRSDIYSLGILLYQLATGRLPFDIRSIGDAAEKHIRVIPPSPREIRPDLPPAVADIILKAIEKQPDDRFQTGEEMARALRNVPADATRIMTMAQATTQEIVSLVTQLLPEVSTFDPPSVGSGLVRPTTADYLLIQQRGQADYTHELEKAVIVIGRSEACDIVLDAPGISRQHARLERTTTGWQISDMGSSNGTWVKDSQLLPNIPETWEAGSAARLGPYFLQWQPGAGTAVQKQTRQAAHHPAFMKTPPHSGVTQLVTMGGQLGVMVDPTNAEVAPGGRTEVQVELSNQGTMVDHFELRVSGLPPEWMTLPSEPVQLMPGGSSLLPLTIHPPRTSSARAGRSAYQLFIYSASTRKRVAKIDGSVTVEPFTGFSFEARPTRLVNEGVCRVSLRNEGNSPAAFALSGSDPGEVIRFQGEQQSVTVPPGQSVELPLKVHPRSRPFFGKTEVFPFQLQVQSTTGESQQQQGVLEVRARLPTWIMTIIPILLMICCIGGSVGAYAWFNYNQGVQQTETAVAELTARAQETPIGVVEDVTQGPDLAATQVALDALNANATVEALAAQNDATSTALAFAQQTIDAQQQAQQTMQAEQQAQQTMQAEQTAAAATEQAAVTDTPTPTPPMPTSTVTPTPTDSPLIITVLPLVGIAQYQVVTNDFSLAAGAFLRETATCPAGRKVLGGGASVIGAGSADFDTQIQESRPGSIGGETDNLWLIAMKNLSNTQRTVRIYAICAAPPSGYEIVTEDATLAGAGFQRDSARCPAGKKVLGGGAGIIGAGSADFNTRIQESTRGSITAPDGERDLWMISVRNFSNTQYTLRISAICATQPVGYELVSRDVTLVAGGFQRDTAICPAGTKVVGGGASVIGAGSADFNTRIQESGPGSVSAVGGERDLWLISIKNLSNTQRTVRISGICART